MKLHKLTYDDRDHGLCLEWFTRVSDAYLRIKELQGELGYTPNHTITPMEIPTDKNGLMNWLNEHFTRDNG